jgi:hypothetical protein
MKGPSLRATIGFKVLGRQADDGATVFGIEWSSQYVAAEAEYLDCVASNQPNTLVLLLQRHGYHSGALLQLASLSNKSGQFEQAAEMLERAVFFFEVRDRFVVLLLLFCIKVLILFFGRVVSGRRFVWTTGWCECPLHIARTKRFLFACSSGARCWAAKDAAEPHWNVVKVVTEKKKKRKTMFLRESTTTKSFAIVGSF